MTHSSENFFFAELYSICLQSMLDCPLTQSWLINHWLHLLRYLLLPGVEVKVSTMKGLCNLLLFYFRCQLCNYFLFLQQAESLCWNGQSFKLKTTSEWIKIKPVLPSKHDICGFSTINIYFFHILLYIYFIYWEPASSKG